MSTFPTVDKTQGLIGFREFGLAVITANTAEAYTTEAYNAIPYAQVYAPTAGTTSGSVIAADDEVYMSGAAVSTNQTVVTFAQLDLERLGFFTGGKVESGEFTLSYKTPGVKPQVAISYLTALSNDGGVRAHKHYVATITNVEQTTINTRSPGSGDQVAGLNVTFEFTDRLIDGIGNAQKNFTNDEVAAKNAWLRDFSAA